MGCGEAPAGTERVQDVLVPWVLTNQGCIQPDGSRWQRREEALSQGPRLFVLIIRRRKENMWNEERV